MYIIHRECMTRFAGFVVYSAKSCVWSALSIVWSALLLLRVYCKNRRSLTDIAKEQCQ